MSNIINNNLKLTFNFLVVFFLVLIVSGCSTLTNVKLANDEIKVDGKKKMFEQEDKMILLALRAEQLKEYSISADIFNTLYEKSNKKEYLYRSLKNDLAIKKYAKVIKRVDEITLGKFNDLNLIRIKIIALISLNELELAKTISMLLVQESEEVNDYIIVSEIYVRLQKYDTALKYLESAYAKNFNEKILDRLSIILYVNLDRKKDAIAQLESHSLMYKCSKLICERLLSFYSDENDIDGLLSTYLRLYKIDKSEKIAIKIIQIYGYKKDYIKLMTFLENSSSDDKLLLQLYIQGKNYEKAALLAKKIYKDTAEIDYLGQNAIFEYELSKNKNDSKMQNIVINKLKRVVQVDDNSLYLNYLGYLLIDHDINIKLGMQYIEKALEKEPNSAYYLDSKAWGYYKLGECLKAEKLILKVIKLEGGNEPEILEHYEKIKKCKEIKNKGKQ
ncbi:MAG: hypothetical protein L3I99_00065 [Sulfurimonas sp.]|nr:hypothetical protein [Sulfurimonas sp.]